MIDFINAPDFIADDRILLQDWLLRIGKTEGRDIDALAYNFVDPEQIQRINKVHLGHNYVTDIITFGYGRTRKISGEVYICTDRVKEQAFEWGEPVEREFLRVIAHGLLHLMGHNDTTSEEKEKMRRLEEKSLLLHAQISEA